MIPSMKRAIGVILMLLMGHLTLVGTDSACAKHGSAMATAAHRAHSMAVAVHEIAHSTTSAGSPKDSCKIPARADCCAALASCAPTLAPAPVGTIDEHMLINAPLPLAANTWTPAPLTAPETPPPRA